MNEMRLATELQGFGPFFTVDVHFAGDAPGGTWQPMSNLIGAALQPRVERVRAALAQRAGCDVAGIDIRVAASVTHLGLTARIIAPMLATAAMGIPLQWNLETLWWRDELGRPYPLSVTPLAIGPNDGRAPLGLAVEGITLAIIDRFPIGDRVPWGNIGSAINSAAQMISQARPDLSDAAREAADAALADRRIDGGALRSGPLFQRRSCCLIYRIGQGSQNYCGDCILKS